MRPLIVPGPSHLASIMPNVAELICESASNELIINRKIKTIQCFLLFTLSILMSFFEGNEKENPVP
jgi:hypothetical protein